MREAATVLLAFFGTSASLYAERSRSGVQREYLKFLAAWISSSTSHDTVYLNYNRPYDMDISEFETLVLILCELLFFRAFAPNKYHWRNDFCSL